MKTATFLIPVAGMALTGCADPVIGDWDIVEAAGYQLPYSYSVSYYGYSCSFQLSTTALSVTDDLAASFRFEWHIDCFGYTSSDGITYTGTVSVVEKKARYTISLTGEEALILGCSMQDKTLLDCTDQDGAVWSLQKLAD